MNEQTDRQTQTASANHFTPQTLRDRHGQWVAW